MLKTGIVGTLGAGKTHFLTTLLKDAEHEQGLRESRLLLTAQPLDSPAS